MAGVFLDISKALDKIWHERINHKLNVTESQEISEAATRGVLFKKVL